MPSQFGKFTASELYCPKCQRAQPVRERLLLILPDGELFEFLCVGCGGTLGQRKVTGPAIATAKPPPRHVARRPQASPASVPRRPRGLLS